MRSIFRPACAKAVPLRRLLAFVAIALGLLSGLAAATPAADDAPAATEHRVKIEGMVFSPASVKIRPGDRVIFENRDLVPHTATAKGPGGFDSGVIQKEANWSVTLTERGTVRYACLLHPTMTGTIIVGE